MDNDLQAGDPCPNCGGELRPARVPTAEQSAAARDRENPTSLDPSFDTASPAQRKQLGALYRCASCPYNARFKDVKPASRPAPAPAAASAAQNGGAAGQAGGDAGDQASGGGKA
jgi:hypothetical protein